MSAQTPKAEQVESLHKTLAEKTAQLEALTTELERFSYSVSHDLRAPLRAIEGFAKIILEDYTDKLDDDGKRFLKIIDASSRKMTDLLDDLLILSRFGRQEMNFTRLKMNDIVNAAWQELSADIGSRKIDFIVDALPDCWGDAALVEQIFKQLLENAIKFTATKKDAVIKVTGNAEADRVVYSVKDNGVGFNMKSAPRLFGVFQRLHTPEEFEGNGIGLALVQRLARRQSGSAWIEAKEGEGAEIFFALPQTR